MKKLVSKLACATLTAVMLCSAIPVIADNTSGNVRFSVNNTEIGGEQTPVIINNLTYLPLRTLFNSIQADFNWDAENKSITATKNGTTLKMWINRQEYRVNNQEKTMESVPVILNGSAYIPVRLVGDSFGLKTEWNSDERMVNIVDGSIKEFSKDVVLITSEATTESTTAEPTTEATTVDPNMSIIPGVSKKVFQRVCQDVAKANSSYTLGRLDSNPILSGFDNTRLMKQWDEMCETDEEKSFVSAAKGYLGTIRSAYSSLESAYNNTQYREFKEIARDYLDRVRSHIATFGNIKSISDIGTKSSELRDSYSTMNSALDDVKMDYRIAAGE